MAAPRATADACTLRLTSPDAHRFTSGDGNSQGAVYNRRVRYRG